MAIFTCTDVVDLAPQQNLSISCNSLFISSCIKSMLSIIKCLIRLLSKTFNLFLISRVKLGGVATRTSHPFNRYRYNTMNKHNSKNYSLGNTLYKHCEFL